MDFKYLGLFKIIIAAHAHEGLLVFSSSENLQELNARDSPTWEEGGLSLRTQLQQPHPQPSLSGQSRKLDLQLSEGPQLAAADYTLYISYTTERKTCMAATMTSAHIIQHRFYISDSDEPILHARSTKSGRKEKRKVSNNE